jgi:RND family efflux transporter MFP subunit
MSNSSLEQLRIDRPEETSTGSPWKWLLPLLVVLLAAVGWWLWSTIGGPAEVRTAIAREVKSGSAAGAVLNSSGYVTARRQATVSSKFTGRVSEVLIEEGMTVEAGQVLARLDDANIRAAYKLAEAQMLSARRSQDETRALLDEARLSFERVQKLVDQNLASVAELDRARALAGSLEARLERNRADVEVAERQLDIYAQQLEDTIIRAPFAGVVVAKNAQPGEMVSPVSAGGGFTRTGIGTIVDMGSLEIEIDVNEAYINRVQPGQPAVATLDAYPDWRIPAHVIAIIPTADRQRATVEVRVGFDELDQRMLPDMGVKVAFQEAEHAAVVEDKGGVRIPAEAVRRDGGRDVVFVVSNGRVERRAIAVSKSAGSTILVGSGLAAGERVVVEGPETLADGDPVRERKE